MRKWILAGLGMVLVLLFAFGANAQSWVESKAVYKTTVSTVLAATTIAAGDSLDVELGDISRYWEIYIKCNATTWRDSVTVRVGTSESLTWAAGNTTYFDKNPGTAIVEYWGLTASLTTEGTCIPLMNAYGAYLPGPYGILRVVNDSLNDLVGLEIILIKRK